MPTTKKIKEKKDNFEVMMREVAKYIEFHEGKAMLLGGISVEKIPPLKYRYRFIIDFTGKPPLKVKSK